MHTTLATWTVLFLCALLSFPAAAQQANDAQPKPAATPNAPAATPAAAPNATAAAAKPAAPTNAPALDPNARNIRFQFDGIPYMDVLERFAQMTGKPLIASTNIQGTLTFTDANPYNYHEALEVLNLMLSMKSVMLVESGHYLQLVPFKELPQMPLPILRGTDKTGDVRPGDVVTVVLDLKSLEAKEVAESIAPMLSNAGSVAPLSRGRGLILTDRLQNIQRIKFLLSQVDNDKVADRQMRTFTLLHSSGAVVADLINRTFGIATAPKRTQFNAQTKNLDVLPPDPSDYVTAVFDDASRTLVLFGPRERIGLAEELITRFEDKEGAGDVRIYFPQAIKADDLATMIRQAVAGVAGPNETAASAATKARLIADTNQNRLIVAAPLSGQLDEIERLINRVDKPIHGTGGGVAQATKSQTVQVTKVFRVRGSDAPAVAKILTEALAKRLPNGQTIPSANVAVEPTSQSVVVTGSPGDVQNAVDIITQLETGSTTPIPQQTKFIDVGSVTEAKRLLPLIEQIYRSQVTDSIGGQTAHAKILADAETGRLIVTASDEHLAKIEGIVKQLRAEKAKPTSRRLQIVTLKNVQVNDVLTGITSLVNDRMGDRRFEDVPKPSLVPDAPNNRLLVTATEEQLKEIESVVAILDVKPVTASREMTVIPVQSKSAAELIATISQLLTQFGDQPSNPQLAPKLIPDNSGKQILALATAQDLERIRTLVQQLDTATATAAARQFKGIELSSRNATEFTPLVQQLYQEQLKGLPEPAGGPATLIAEPKDNRIMVSGSEKEIAKVEAIIRQLDPAEKRAVKEETRVLRLKSGLAADLAQLVEKSMSAQGQRVRVLVDARSNSLILTGDPSSVDAAVQIIDQLDTRSDAGPREMRIIDLRSGDVASLAPMVTSMLADLMKDQRGAEYTTQTKIIPDTSGNRLIVTGPRGEIAEAARLIEKLDQTPEQSGSARVFKLQTSSATLLAPIVSNAMVRFDARGQAQRKVTVSADEKSNSLIITGARTDVQDAAVIIERLDGQSDDGVEKARHLKIVSVNTSEPEQLAALAMRVFAAQSNGRNITNLISITPEPSGKRLIVLAPPSMLLQVETVITMLDQPADKAGRELHSIDVKQAVNEILPVVTRIYSEQSQGKTLKPASIYPDASGSRLAVWGSKEQAEAIRQIVSTLESGTRPPRETKVFDVGRLAEAQRLMPLAQQLYRDQFASQAGSGPADAQFISDGRTGRVIVSGRQDHLKSIDEIFARLQAGVGTNQTTRETKTIEVGTAADVQRIQPLVQQLYTDQWRDRTEVDPADAQIMADARGGKLIISGKPEHLRAIETIIKQLGTGEPKSATNASRETRVFDLTTANAMELATTVRTLYTEQAKVRLGTLTPDTMIMPDASANRIIVSGEKEELAAVEDIIQKLDKIGAQSASARVFKLKSAEPDKVAEILQTALVRYDAYGRPQKRVSVSVDPKTRTIIATGDPKELQSASVIIEQLDSSLGTQAERQMKVVALGASRVSDISAKLRQLYADQIKSHPEMGTADALILDDATSNQIILAGSAPQLELLQKIVADLQSAFTSQGARETRMLSVARADDVTRLLPTVQQLYQERWRDKSPADPADAQILPDAKNSRFIVTARTNHIAEIQNILAKLQDGAAAPEPRDTRVYDLTTASALELSTTVKTLYQEQVRSRATPPASEVTIMPDATANRIVVSGATNELEVVEDIIKKLDKVSAQSATARVFKLKSAEPEKVLEILQTALVRYDGYGRPQKRVSVSVDPKTRTLIATGDPKELASASVIIEQLDSSLGTQPERKMKVIPTKAISASNLATRVRTLYQDRAKSQPELGTTDVLIMEDAQSNQLVLAGNDAQLKVVEEIIEQLEQHAMQLAPREQKVFDVGSAEEAARLQPLVQQLYQDKWRDLKAGDPVDAQIISDSKNGRLIVSGRSNHVAEIETILLRLNAPSTNSAPPETRVYDLASSSAAELATTVKTLYSEQLKVRAAIPVAQPVILPDAAANRLIVSGPSNELAFVEEIVRKLDKADGQSGSARVFKLKHADPEQVSSLLSSSLTRQTPLGRSVPRVSVGSDVRNAMLIVSGEARDLQAAAAIVEQMDAAESKEPRQVRIIPLKNGGNAGDVSTKLKQLYADQLKGKGIAGAPDALILGDDTANRLIITASESHLKVIEDIVKQLEDAGEGAGRQLRVIPLERQSASSVALMMQQLYGRRMFNADPTLRMNISASPDDRTLVVDAQGRVFEEIEKLVKTLDDAMNDSKSVIQTVQLKKGQADDLAQALTRSITQRGLQGRLQKVNVTAVDGANSLLLNGPNDAVQEVLKIIRELDTESDDGEIKVRIYKLENGNVKEIQSVLNQVLQGVTMAQRRRGARGAFSNLSIDDRSNSLIVSGSDAHFAVIEQLLKTLDKVPEKSARDVEFFFLKNARAADVVTKLEAIFADREKGEKPVIESESFGNSVTVIGRKVDVAQARELINRLDETSKDSTVQVRLRPLDSVPADQMARMLQNIYPQMSAAALRLVEKLPPTTNMTNNAQAMTNAQGRIEVIIAIDKQANALILSGPANELDQLDRIVSDLSFSFYGNDTEFRLFSLKEADPVVVARTLTELFKVEAVRVEQGQRPGEIRHVPEKPKIAAVAEPRTRSVIVRARPTDFGFLEGLIKELDEAQITGQLEFRVVPVTNSVPEKLLPLVQQMVNQLNTARPGDPLTVTVDGRSRGLLIVARGTVIEQIEKMIRGLDTPSVYAEAEVLVISLKKANSAQLSAVLQNMLKPGAQGEWTVEARELQEQIRRLKIQNDSGQTVLLDLTKPIKIMSDPVAGGQGGNRLILTSTPDNLKALAAVVTMMDTVALGEGVEVKIVRLEHADATVMSSTLTAVFSQAQRLALGPGGRTQPEGAQGKGLIDPLNVAVDERNNAVILSGRKESLELAQKIISEIDKDVPVELRDIRILRLEHADVGEIAGQLQRLMDARVQQRSSLGKNQAEAYRVLIIPDPRSNSLLVGGSKDSFELVEALAKQLDQAPTALSGQIRQVVLQYADARNIATALNQLFTQRYAGAKTADVQRNRPVIVPDPRSNALLISAAVDDNKAIDELLAKLDRKLDDPALQLTVLPLKHNDSSRMAPMLQRVFLARLQSRTPPGQTPSPQDRVTIETDPLNNSLVVSASRENLETINELLQKLDVEPTTAAGTLETFTLKFADAQRVAGILRSLVDQGLYRPGAPMVATGVGAAKNNRDALAITVDPRSNTMIVSASPENLALVRAVIAQVDTKDFAADGNVKLYVLKNARASSLATVLEQFFRQKRAGEAQLVNAAERTVPVTIVPDDRSNTLLVTGTKEGFDVIERLMQQLDGDDARARMNFRVLPLKQATATKLQDVLRQLFANRPPRVKGEPVEPITVVADAWVNAIILGASADDMGMAVALVERLDSDQGGPGTAVQVFPLAKADARRVAQIVQGLYREGTTTTALPVSVTADERMNAIVVSAGEADVRRIGDLMKKLDSDQIARVSEIRVFPLKYARSETMASILNTALNTKAPALSEQSPNAQAVLQFIARAKNGNELVTSALREGVLITPDSRMNSLIVSAPVDYMELLEQIITRLDNSAHQKAKIKVFTLKNADARQTAELLVGLFRLQQSPALIGTQRSVEYTLVKTVHRQGDAALTGTEEEVASAVLGSDEQSALTVTVDPRTNSLLVGGTEDYVELVSQIIESLDSSEAMERKTEVIPLRNAQAQDLATAVRSFLDQEKQRVTQVLGNDAVGTAQRLLEREIAVVPEPQSNNLLLSASPRYFDEVRALIDKLDQPQPQVLIQVLVAEVSLDSALDLGLEWTYKGVPFAAGIDISEAKWITMGFASAVTGGDYNFLFRMLEDKGRLEVLSRPQIVTADNKSATISIGQTIPLITDSRVDPQNNTINSFRYQNVGVNFRVTPRIAPDGFVKLEVATTNSTLSSATVQVNKNAEVPIINERIANTTVSVQSGQSILIGGLIGTLDDKRVRKVPYIGDVPVLGWFFRSNRNRQERRELLILLTPQILTQPDAMLAKTVTTREMTDEALQNSRIKDEIQRDPVQKQILDPVFPENEFESKPLTKPDVKSPK